jgi:hypothetical protein
MILVGTKIRWKIATLDSIRDLDSSYWNNAYVGIEKWGWKAYYYSFFCLEISYLNLTLEYKLSPVLYNI